MGSTDSRASSFSRSSSLARTSGNRDARLVVSPGSVARSYSTHPFCSSGSLALGHGEHGPVTVPPAIPSMVYLGSVTSRAFVGAR
jgi:hypothetical protein